MNVAWNGMRVLSQLQIWYNGMLSNCCGLWTTHNKMDKCIYIIREGKSIESEIIADDVTMKFNKNYDLVIFRYPSLDDSETFLYKRYNELPSNLSEDKPIKSLFIVVNIRYGIVSDCHSVSHDSRYHLFPGPAQTPCRRR